jgi:hypothetical protein
MMRKRTSKKMPKIFANPNLEIDVDAADEH